MTVVAESFAPRVTSVVAGALWEWPPAVCGYHRDVVSLRRSKVWCRTSLRDLQRACAEPAGDGRLRQTGDILLQAADRRGPRSICVKMEELKHEVGGFRHDPALIAEARRQPRAGSARRVHAPGPHGRHGCLYAMAASRGSEGRAAASSSARSAGRFPPRRSDSGAAVRGRRDRQLHRPGGKGARRQSRCIRFEVRSSASGTMASAMPRITEAHCISLDNSDEERGFVFIVPRGEDMLVLGGLAEPNEWDLDIGLHNYEPVRQMYRALPANSCRL